MKSLCGALREKIGRCADVALREGMRMRMAEDELAAAATRQHLGAGVCTAGCVMPPFQTVVSIRAACIVMHEGNHVSLCNKDACDAAIK